MTAKMPGATRGHKKGQANKPRFEKDMCEVADVLMRPDFFECEIRVDDQGRERIGGKLKYKLAAAVREVGKAKPEISGHDGALRKRVQRNFSRKVTDGEAVISEEVKESRLDDALIRLAKRAKGGSKYIPDRWKKRDAGG